MSEPADLILHGGRVWTVDPERPEARAVAVRGDRFVAVGPEQEVLGLRGPATQVIELGDRLVLPGFIDAHTHFENAAAWLFRVSLYEVGDAPLAIDKVAAAAQLVPEGLWITGGDLGPAGGWGSRRSTMWRACRKFRGPASSTRTSSAAPPTSTSSASSNAATS